jgi:uncharacterized protein (TIGR02145 family)
MFKKNIKPILIIVVLITMVFSNACKEDVVKPQIQTDSLVDIDGNVYKTVKIGKQWWMAENLKVKKYRNGNSILEVPYNSSIIWDSTLTKGAWCLYFGAESGTGLLYNWYAVSDTSNIAPDGWHVATDNDWKELEKYLGVNSNEIDLIGWRGSNQGNKLKPEQNEGWYKSNNINQIWGNNESGFTALAGSCRLYNGIWGDPGLFFTAFWWTSTEHTDSLNKAWFRHLDYSKASIFRYYGHKSSGYSIRCVKDSE